MKLQPSESKVFKRCIAFIRCFNLVLFVIAICLLVCPIIFKISYAYSVKPDSNSTLPNFTFSSNIGDGVTEQYPV